MTDQHTSPSLDAIARPGGAFAMVAMDQRESLRAMFDAAGSGRPADDVLTSFKLDVARTLGPLASGFLIDRHYGLDEIQANGILPDDTGLIVAADALTQEDGGPVEETTLDDVVIAPEYDLGSAVAIKLLIIWRRDDRREQRVQLARDFVRVARERGVLSVLEPVVRALPSEVEAGTWEVDVAIREAAEELSPLGADLYKAQVPGAGRGTAEEQVEASRKLGAAITGPWVVLSQGVAVDDFLPAVKAACLGGASGFLAGRALWADVVGSDDVPARLREVSVPRLERLVAVVDEHARPWRDA